jgi:hypothetical protein
VLWIAWLKSQRNIFADLTAQLESSVLTVSDDRMQSLLAKEKTKLEGSGKYAREPAWENIDCELEEHPSAIPNAGNDLWIEWTYIVDLDSELFSVNNWITFDLENIPRDRWRQGFKYGDEGQNVFSFEVCPEGSCGIDSLDYFADADDERDNYRNLYQQHSIKMVEVTTDAPCRSQIPLQQILALAVFEYLTNPRTSSSNPAR